MEEIMNVEVRELTSEQLQEITDFSLSLADDANIFRVSYTLEGDRLVIRCARRTGMNLPDGPCSPVSPI